LLFGLLLVLLACNRVIKPEIVTMEFKNNGCTVHRFISISPFLPVVGADSLQWLQMEYDSLYQAKLSELNLQVAEQNKNLAVARMEFDTMANSTMKRVYKPILDGMELRFIQLKQIQETYLNHAEQTQFGIIAGRINYYRLNQTKLLGYWVQANFTGVQGNLPVAIFQNYYIFDPSKKNIQKTNRKVSISR